MSPEQYAAFYDGDSYIVLHTYMKGDKIANNVHFWLGQHTTQDEAGTAAYKTVELDTVLGGLPIQFREVQGSESDEFLKLFKPAFITAQGGIDSAFHHQKPTEYKPRLMQVKGKRKNVAVMQVKLSRDSLNDGDVFILGESNKFSSASLLIVWLDNGLSIFQWNGTKAGVFEKRKANEVCSYIRDSRSSKPKVTVLDGTEKNDAFWNVIGGYGPVKSADEGGSDDAVSGTEKKLLRLSSADGSLKLTEVAKGTLRKSMLTSDAVFLVDLAGTSLFVYVGKNATHDGTKCFQVANQYIQDAGLPFTIPVSRVVEGHSTAAFDQAFET